MNAALDAGRKPPPWQQPSGGGGGTPTLAERRAALLQNATLAALLSQGSAQLLELDSRSARSQGSGLAPQRIAAAGSAFAAEHVRGEDALLYIRDLLKQYAAVQVRSAGGTSAFQSSCRWAAVRAHGAAHCRAAMHRCHCLLGTGLCAAAAPQGRLLRWPAATGAVFNATRFRRGPCGCRIPLATQPRRRLRRGQCGAWAAARPEPVEQWAVWLMRLGSWPRHL